MTTEKYVERTITNGGGSGPDHSKTISAQEYLHSANAGAGVPLLQATITGLVIAIPVLVILLKNRVTDAWYWAAGVWALIQAITWIINQMHWFSLTNIEKLTGIDLNKDGVIGDGKGMPGESVRTIKINLHEISEGGYVSVTTARFPVDEESMAILAAGLLNGIPFAERYWIGAGKIFSQAQFRDIRSEMLKRGILELANPKSPQQGYQLTRAGRACMRDLASHPNITPPPPMDGLDPQE